MVWSHCVLCWNARSQLLRVENQYRRLIAPHARYVVDRDSIYLLCAHRPLTQFNLVDIPEYDPVRSVHFPWVLVLGQNMSLQWFPDDCDR
jgi:hypothetical protein